MFLNNVETIARSLPSACIPNFDSVTSVAAPISGSCPTAFDMLHQQPDHMLGLARRASWLAPSVPQSAAFQRVVPQQGCLVPKGGCGPSRMSQCSESPGLRRPRRPNCCTSCARCSAKHCICPTRPPAPTSAAILSRALEPISPSPTRPLLSMSTLSKSTATHRSSTDTQASLMRALASSSARPRRG
jgi:hypothetical protein